MGANQLELQKLLSRKAAIFRQQIYVHSVRENSREKES